MANVETLKSRIHTLEGTLGESDHTVYGANPTLVGGAAAKPAAFSTT